MPDTNAPLSISIQGSDASQRLEQAIKVHQPIRIGRGPQRGWAIPWDRMISREHADLLWDGVQLTVQAAPNARNPLLYRGEPLRELRLEPGDWFQIGQTTFHTQSLQPISEIPDAESTAAFRFEDMVGYTPSDLRKVKFQNAPQQLELLAELPDAIRKSICDEDLCGMLSRLLLAALPQAEGVAVAHYDLATLPKDLRMLDQFPRPLIMRTELRENYTGRFRPSRGIISQALRNERSLIHISAGENSSGGGYTMSEGLGWSFCCPVRGDATKGWCIYVSGRGSRTGSMIINESDLVPDLRFTELVAQFLGSIRQVRSLQEQKTQFSTFFSPKVIESLADPTRSVELLAPAERNVTVLFCDVRGFTRKSERLKDDLLSLLHSVSGALQVMAMGIQDNDGTIADFQGDAALGFWGWPVAPADGPIPACRAALQIYQEFRLGTQLPGSPLEGFTIGLGISHGPAIAGQIGTLRQAKVGVFGPVVNLGARLEGVSRQFGVPICMDEATAQSLRNSHLPDLGLIRCLARVRPKGMQTPVTVYALLPSMEDFPDLTPGLLEKHEVAVTAVIEGDWDRAREILQCFPTADGPAQRLLRLMADMDNRPPDDWDGAFSLTSK